MKRILLVEDEHTLRNFLKASLQVKGFIVVEAQDFQEALGVLDKEAIDLLLLDADLSESGLKDQFAAFKNRFPNVFVLAMAIGEGEVTKADLLVWGVDDFISKPFAFPDLMTRIHRILRPPTSECLLPSVRGLRVDLKEKGVFTQGKALTLTPLEWECLAILCERAGKVVDESVLGQALHRKAPAEDSRLLLKMIIWNLRQKLEDEPLHPQIIKTVAGVGYRLETMI